MWCLGQLKEIADVTGGFVAVFGVWIETNETRTQKPISIFANRPYAALSKRGKVRLLNQTNKQVSKV